MGILSLALSKKESSPRSVVCLHTCLLAPRIRPRVPWGAPLFSKDALTETGASLLWPRILPLYLIYRPANNIPYATMEEDLPGQFEHYCRREGEGSGLAPASPSEVGQKCCAFQHWLYQWTNGNILVTDLEGEALCRRCPASPVFLLAFWARSA